MKLKSIFFDMDCTLCDTHRSNLLTLQDFRVKLAESLPGQPSASIPQIFMDYIYRRKFNPQWQKVLDGCKGVKNSRVKLLDFILQEQLKLQCPMDQIAELEHFFQERRNHHYQLFPGVGAMLARLRLQFCLLVLTNGPTYSQYPRLEKSEMRSRVDHIIVGGEHPFQKPDPRIFEMACQKAGCTPGQAIHIGDDPISDIAGAKASSIRSVWIKVKNGENSGVECQADFELEDILEVEALAQSLESL